MAAAVLARLVLVVALSVAAAACDAFAPVEEGTENSVTTGLSQDACVEDRQCQEGLACLCGLCSRVCEADADCDGVECLPASALDLVHGCRSMADSTCHSTCVIDADCAHLGAEAACQNRLCKRRNCATDSFSGICSTPCVRHSLWLDLKGPANASVTPSSITAEADGSELTACIDSAVGGAVRYDRLRAGSEVSLRVTCGSQVVRQSVQVGSSGFVTPGLPQCGLRTQVGMPLSQCPSPVALPECD